MQLINFSLHANSVDLDPYGAVLSGSALYAAKAFKVHQQMTKAGNSENTEL